HIATYLTGSNVVTPLDHLFEDAKYGFGGSEVKYDSPSKDEVIPQFLNEGIIGEHNYAIPYMRSTEAVYINKTFVEKLVYKLPKVLTLDFVWKVSEAAMKKNKNGTFKVNGQKTMIPFIYKSTDNMMIQMLKQLNADYSTEEGEILLFNDATKAILKEIARHGKTGAFSTFKISSYPANFLDAGQCIFAVDSTAGATWMGSHAPLSDISADKFVEFETAVRMVPQFDTENPKMISQGPSICIFNKTNPQEVLASWLFAQYLLTDDVQVAYAKTEGYVPVTSKARNTKEYKKYLADAGKDNSTHYQVKIDASEILLKADADTTFTTPVFVGSASLRDASGELIESTVKAVRRKTTVDDAYLDNLFNDVTSLYRLNQSSAAHTSGSLGKMPTMSIALMVAIAVIWVCIGIYVLRDYLNKRKKI
ncbi:MAG: extracellular solute-binding protein, partial [Erysipelotrichaceae bacterium]|nr:extracellular solute-binding protein [Erysipelotrichaceae bacterium]